MSKLFFEKVLAGQELVVSCSPRCDVAGTKSHTSFVWRILLREVFHACVVCLQEVDAMHRVEMLHLQAYAESGQAGSSPYVPLRDSKFKRKRELLGLPCD